MYQVLTETQTNKSLLGSTGYNFSHALDRDIVINLHPPFCPRLISETNVCIEPSKLEDMTKVNPNKLYDKGTEKEMRMKRGHGNASDMVVAKEAKKRRIGEDQKKHKYKF